jgi:hypothetical protein
VSDLSLKTVTRSQRERSRTKLANNLYNINKKQEFPMTTPLLFGPYGSQAIEYAAHFADYGANAFWFHGFDPQAFEACQQHQIAACVEFKTFRADFETRPELIPTGVNGKPIRYGNLVQGVCLSQVEFLQETEKNLLEGLRSYQPAGIWLDYLTYAGWFETPHPDLQESCFCPDCIAHFCESSGVDAESPTVILQNYSEDWTRHKCERIASFAKHYAKIIKSHLPDCIVGAYMCPWRPDEFEGALTRIFAQDYTLMAPAIDVFTPLIYGKKSGRSSEWGREFLEGSNEFVPNHQKVQLILDALDFPESMVETARSTAPSWGFQMFGGAQVFIDPAKAEIFHNAVKKIRGKILN